MSREARAKITTALFHLTAVAVPLCIFLHFFHWQILLPTNTRWLLAGDWGANVIGWNAFRHDGWHWPLAQTRLLAWPTGVPITFTDSNPLVSLLLKPFAAVLPTPFQFIGPWLFGCIVLQFAVAYALLRHATSDRWLRLIGAALFTLAPTLINRMGHANLCAHWTILLSLHVYLNVESEKRRDVWFALILAGSSLIHPYFLPMNAAIWGSDVLRRGCPLLGRRAFRELGWLTGRSAMVLAAPAAALWATGAIGGLEGDGGGFGYYSMALDALINPGFAGYSRLLPVAPEGEGQTFEGFQYLGAGLLALVAVAAVMVLVSPAARQRLRGMNWLAWLAPALFVLFALALSDRIQLHGHTVARLSYSWIPFHFTGAFRSSGRLFWPCAYVLILVCLELVFVLPKVWGFAIGVAALGLQLFDLTGFTTAARALTAAAAQPERWQLTSSRKWEPLISSAEVVEIQPPDPFADVLLFYEIAWRATSLERPVNIMYTARVNPVQRAIQSASRGRFLRGELDRRHLYVVTDGCVPAGIAPSRLRMVNNVVVIPPADARYPFALRPAPAPAPFPIGQTISLASDAAHFRCLLGQDWSVAEGWGVWSDGGAPELVLNLPPTAAGELKLTVLASSFPERQGVSVLVGGHAVGRWNLVETPAEYSVRIPASVRSGSLLSVVLKVDRPTSPSSRSGSSDTRELGVGLRSVRVDLVAPGA